MQPKEIKSFVLHNIYFATGKTRILDSSEPALNELYRFLTQRPNQRIRIVGHTDNIGSDRSNQTLSEGRCREVKQEMINRGILPERIDIQPRQFGLQKFAQTLFGCKEINGFFPPNITQYRAARERLTAADFEKTFVFPILKR